MTACSSKRSEVPAPPNPGIENPYPALPNDLITPVALPKLREGQDVRVALAQHRAGLKQCRAVLGDLVRFYEQLRQSKPCRLTDCVR